MSRRSIGFQALAIESDALPQAIRTQNPIMFY
jgi:hypothetical protein